MALATTLGELRSSGYVYRTVKEELRANVMTRLGSDQPLFPGVIGFEDSVIPTLERALIAGHDFIVLGERGQAKSRLMRCLAELLDEHVPVVAGCEINDHPQRPICTRCRRLVTEQGDQTPIAWLARDRRLSEKLATPDTSVADLVGDVDPIKVAEGRYLADELTIHYGLLPRTNRGIFAVNELPDLPERIQVALLNVLEERDVQIRGYQIRLPLDILLVASANPDDYTNRGRIISPLKDRFGAQVRTHYPTALEEEIAIMEQEAMPPPPGMRVEVPDYLEEVLARLSAELRSSPEVNQRSGVSVRLSIGSLETLVAGAVRRAVRAGEASAEARITDAWAIVPASIGRVEFDTLEEGREQDIIERALEQAILQVFSERLGGADLRGLVTRFDEGLVIETGDLVPAEQVLAQLDTGERAIPGIEALVGRLGVSLESAPSVAGAVEFAFEGLHLVRRLNKHRTTGPGGWTFSARAGP